MRNNDGKRGRYSTEIYERNYDFVVFLQTLTKLTLQNGHLLWMEF